MAFITSKILAVSQKKQSREHSAAINGKKTCAETRERAHEACNISRFRLALQLIWFDFIVWCCVHWLKTSCLKIEKLWWIDYTQANGQLKLAMWLMEKLHPKVAKKSQLHKLAHSIQLAASLKDDVIVLMEWNTIWASCYGLWQIRTKLVSQLLRFFFCIQVVSLFSLDGRDLLQSWPLSRHQLAWN